MTTILSFLSKILGPYKEYNKGEHYFHCAFCHNSKPKFAINIFNMKYHCWHCNARGVSLLTLCRRLNVSKEQINELRGLITPEELQKYKYYEKQTSIELFLPPEYKPIWKAEKTIKYRHAISYLVKRHILPSDMIRYQMGYCESGMYADRVIIPSYDFENKLNYFVARNFYDIPFMKYKNPTVSKNVIVFENQINWTLPIILCEGVFDAIAIRRNVIPMLGKFLPKKLEQKILEKKVKDITIFLDSDAQIDSQRLSQKLQYYGITVKNVSLTEGDAGGLSFDRVWENIHAAETPTFKDFIMHKLEH